MEKKLEEKKITRRELLKGSIGIVAAVGALGALFKTSQAKAADAPAGPTNPVKLDDPVVKALQYCENADKPTTCPTRKEAARKAEYCFNCQYFTEFPKGSKTGKCQIIASGLVAQNGWCTSYLKDPKKTGKKKS